MRERQTERHDADGEFEKKNNFLVPIHLLERQALIVLLHITFGALFHDPPPVRTHAGHRGGASALPGPTFAVRPMRLCGEPGSFRRITDFHPASFQ